MSTIYDKIKKQNGETFARAIRNYNDAIFEIPDIVNILKHAGREAGPILPFLNKLTTKTNPFNQVQSDKDPFTLLNEAGYDAFYADTEAKKNAIKKYFAAGEELCTFDDSQRHNLWHIIHAVRKDVDTFCREHFRGKEKRDDAYGTSVLSIQVLKTGGHISIKNRYNHTVANCDCTLGSNPDNIILGLSDSIRKHFCVEFTPPDADLSNDFILVGKKIVAFNLEVNNIHFGDKYYVKNGQLHEIDSDKQILMDNFLFDIKNKKIIDVANSKDPFVEVFSKEIADKTIQITKQKNGNHIFANGVDIATVQNGQITALNLTSATELKDNFLFYNRSLEKFSAPQLVKMGNKCFSYCDSLYDFQTPCLKEMGDNCLRRTFNLKQVFLPKLVKMGTECLWMAEALERFDAPQLSTMKSGCLEYAKSLTYFNVPQLKKMGIQCLRDVSSLSVFNAPCLTRLENWNLEHANSLKAFHAPQLESMGSCCLSYVDSLSEFNVPKLIDMDGKCLTYAKSLKNFSAPFLVKMGESCLTYVNTLQNIHVPNLEEMDFQCLNHVHNLTKLYAPRLVRIENNCLEDTNHLTVFHAPNLIRVGARALQHSPSLIFFHAPKLTHLPDWALANVASLQNFDAPYLLSMGYSCLEDAHSLRNFNAPTLKTMGAVCLRNVPSLMHFHAPDLHSMDDCCLANASSLKSFHAPSLIRMGNGCFLFNTSLIKLDAPLLETIGEGCLQSNSRYQTNAPALMRRLSLQESLLKPDSYSQSRDSR